MKHKNWSKQHAYDYKYFPVNRRYRRGLYVGKVSRHNYSVMLCFSKYIITCV